MSEYDEFDKAVANHWSLPLIDSPHALVAVIETKIARAVLAERRRIIALLKESMCDAYGEDCTDNPGCSAQERIFALINNGEI